MGTVSVSRKFSYSKYPIRLRDKCISAVYHWVSQALMGKKVGIPFHCIFLLVTPNCGTGQLVTSTGFLRPLLTCTSPFLTCTSSFLPFLLSSNTTTSPASS